MRGEFTEQEVNEFIAIVKMQVASFEERRKKKVKRVSKELIINEFIDRLSDQTEFIVAQWKKLLKKLSAKEIEFLRAFVR